MSSTPLSLPSCIVASDGSSIVDTMSTTKDVQAFSFPECLPITLITLQHLLDTNDPPSSQDAVAISECIRALDDSIARFNSAIARTASIPLSISPELLRGPWIPAPIDKQKTQLADVQRFRAQVQSVNSIVRLLPQEIWQEIFIFARHSDGLFVFDLQDPVYTVGRVCKTWRSASLRCPRLWSRFVISGSRSLSRGHLYRLCAILQRSCSVPLDFSFARACRSDIEREMHEMLIFLLMHHSSRWRSVEFLEMTLWEARLLVAIRGSIPQLESITLGLLRCESERTDMISALEIAPKLSRAALRGVPLKQVVWDLHSKRNLQSLQLGHKAGEGHLSLPEILQEYPKLMNVDIFCIFKSRAMMWPAPPPLSTPRTVYANLTSLRVVDIDSAGFNLISLPNLTHLDVGYDDGPHYIQWLLSCVISLLQHSQCRLTSLHLHFAEWDVESMGVLLRLVADLETLSISSGGLRGIEEMMWVLTCYYLGELSGGAKRLRPTFVPRLRELGIRLGKVGWSSSLSQWTFVDRVFVDMLAMRAECGLEIVRLCGVRSGAFPSKDWERWKDMKEQGLIEVCA